MNPDDYSFDDFAFSDWLDAVNEQVHYQVRDENAPSFQKQHKDKDVFFSRLLGKEIKVVKWVGSGRCKECAYANYCVNEKYRLLNFRRFEAGRCSAHTRDDSENIMFKPIKTIYTIDSEFLNLLSETGSELESLHEDPEEIVKYQNLLLETYLLGRDTDGN